MCCPYAIVITPSITHIIEPFHKGESDNSSGKASKATGESSAGSP